MSVSGGDKTPGDSTHQEHGGSACTYMPKTVWSTTGSRLVVSIVTAAAHTGEREGANNGVVLRPPNGKLASLSLTV
jgi:hypothetical protein